MAGEGPRFVHGLFQPGAWCRGRKKRAYLVLEMGCAGEKEPHLCFPGKEAGSPVNPRLA